MLQRTEEYRFTDAIVKATLPEWKIKPRERSRIDTTLRKGIKCLKTVRLIYNETKQNVRS